MPTTSYPTRVRYVEAAMGATLRTIGRRGAAAIIVVASDAVDAAFDAIMVQRERGGNDVDNATVSVAQFAAARADA